MVGGLMICQDPLRGNDDLFDLFLAHLEDSPNIPSTVMPGCIICSFIPQQTKKKHVHGPVAMLLLEDLHEVLHHLRLLLWCYQQFFSLHKFQKMELNKTNHDPKWFFMSNKTRQNSHIKHNNASWIHVNLCWPSMSHMWSMHWRYENDNPAKNWHTGIIFLAKKSRMHIKYSGHTIASSSMIHIHLHQLKTLR